MKGRGELPLPRSGRIRSILIGTEPTPRFPGCVSDDVDDQGNAWMMVGRRSTAFRIGEYGYISLRRVIDVEGRVNG